MLYGNCKKVLKAAVYQSAESGKTSALDISVHLRNRIRTEDLNGCLAILEDEGYIQITDRESVVPTIIPTHKGIHFGEYRHKEIEHFLFTSILVPVVVSVVTTLVSLWLNGIFK